MSRFSQTRRQKKRGLINNSKIVPPPGPNQCHPRVKHGTCLPLSILQRAAGILEGGGKSLKSFTNQGRKKEKQNIVKSLYNQLGVKEGNQLSLLKALPFSEEEKASLAKQYLRPPMPEEWKSDPDKWLDSNNIRDVMLQYEEAHPDFKFLGPYPIDFAAPEDSTANSKGHSKECLIDEMCDLDLSEEVLNGIKRIGIIYNLDPHYKSGSHWVANYIDISKKHCYYFDSYGMKPPKQIYEFMQWLTLQNSKIKLGFNGRQFQHQNSECGMYCLYFLDRMIAGDNYLKFCRRAPPDKYMLDFRDWLFST
jgi:hypothetical protein